MQAERRGRAAQYDLDFVALNRLAMRRPAIFRAPDGAPSLASSDASAAVLKAGLSKSHPANTGVLRAQRRSSAGAARPSLAGSLAAGIGVRQTVVENVAARPSTAGCAAAGPSAGDSAHVKTMRFAAQGGARETVALLFGRPPVDDTPAATRANVLARVRARPGAGGSPTAQCAPPRSARALVCYPSALSYNAMI